MLTEDKIMRLSTNLIMGVVTNVLLFFVHGSTDIAACVIHILTAFIVGYAIADLIPGYAIGQKLAKAVGISPESKGGYWFSVAVLSIILVCLTSLVCTIVGAGTLSFPVIVYWASNLPYILPPVFILLGLLIPRIMRLCAGLGIH